MKLKLLTIWGFWIALWLKIYVKYTYKMKDPSHTEPPVAARFNNRRKSVFAETYDPEEDDSDEGAPVVFPKSDAQRTRLAEAVRGILLFRSLDAQQMQQVGH